MDDANRLNPGHTAVRSGLRVAGPLVLGLGLIFLIVGMVSFFSSMGSFEPPRLFWCCFVGMPLMFVGGVMTSTGYMGAMLRYQAAEAAPVGKDTFNYVAEGTKPGIRNVAQAIVEGVKSGEKPKYCSQCGTANDSDSKFCKSCGRAL